MQNLFLWGHAQILMLKILNVYLPALRNAKHIPLGWLKFSPSFRLRLKAAPDKSELEPRLNNKNRFNWAGKIEHFSKVSK
jgi:hypothetical protein